ncbi:MAG: STAS domain-containing protein [Planctomycetota bacterium]|nr:STAS domain-containing protein [Planctomycetota bacterium]
MASAGNATGLKLTHTIDNMIALVQLRGYLDGNSHIAAETYFKMVVTSGSTRVVLDLAQVDFISSAGLRAVISLLKLVKGNHGGLAVCASQPHVTQLLEFSGLKTLLSIAPTVDEGRAALVARFG